MERETGRERERDRQGEREWERERERETEGERERESAYVIAGLSHTTAPASVEWMDDG